MAHTSAFPLPANLYSSQAAGYYFCLPVLDHSLAQAQCSKCIFTVAHLTISKIGACGFPGRADLTSAPTPNTHSKLSYRFE